MSNIQKPLFMVINKNTIFSIFIVLVSIFGYSQNGVNQHDANGKKNGKWIKYFEEEEPKQVRYEGTFEHGQEIGVFKFYEPKSGKQPVATKEYTKGSNKVLVTFYNKAGKVVSKGHMVDKKREGKWEIFHKNGTQLMLIETYKNDKLHGEKITYFPNGNVAMSQHYKNGVLHGQTLIYGDNKTIIQKYAYVDGKVEGHASFYDSEGNLLTEGNYKNGLKDGIWKIYENGELVEEELHPKPIPTPKAKP
ncbi:toxin-antitoxin system YwqK family antitoxin [Mesonia sp. K7]|uniref:toxin-antitoxin system YwqK family antitoxin n=1 Tax=Mesonia sp. K7 TaxID=2218606 RepID=UPI000DA9E63D|nr:toxin-antitoxin system YwqK family antitoxin [Mesonia sp. K7]PZD77859.1 hypothetical protein DNG35_07110 [Mesonia sp. K7]